MFLDNEPANPLLLTEFLDGNWHTVRVNFTATSTSATIIFAGELDARTPGGPGITTDVAYFIDNISVTQTSPAARSPRYPSRPCCCSASCSRPPRRWCCVNVARCGARAGSRRHSCTRSRSRSATSTPSAGLS